MCIGYLDGNEDLWVSFDKRGDSHYPKYWSDAGEPLSNNRLTGKVIYAKGLELSHFKAKKKAKKQRPQMEKQKLLIRKVYLQGGNYMTVIGIRSKLSKRLRMKNRAANASRPNWTLASQK